MFLLTVLHNVIENDHLPLTHPLNFLCFPIFFHDNRMPVLHFLREFIFHSLSLSMQNTDIKFYFQIIYNNSQVLLEI